jgi:divalent metal cation (Fe/Co/Zn/Cd) transporter
VKLAEHHELPASLHPTLRRAVRLEALTLVYAASVIVLMYLVMGSSQAMKAAWVEDMLMVIPPVAFLITVPLRHRPASQRYPYGYHRTVTIAFLCASVALLGLGLYLLVDSASKLLSRERPTIGSVEVFGRVVWLGWVMLPVLAWGVVGSVLLGRWKVDPARALHDKTLFADAQMNRADWKTAVAAAVGVLGIALGLWWADAVAALVISLDVLRDGVKSTVASVGDLLDRRPESVDHRADLPLDQQIVSALERLPWVRGAEVRLREAGHVFFGEVFVVPAPDTQDLLARVDEAATIARATDWRIVDVTVEAVKQL